MSTRSKSIEEGMVELSVDSKTTMLDSFQGKVSKYCRRFLSCLDGEVRHRGTSARRVIR